MTPIGASHDAQMYVGKTRDDELTDCTPEQLKRLLRAAAGAARSRSTDDLGDNDEPTAATEVGNVEVVRRNGNQGADETAAAVRTKVQYILSYGIAGSSAAGDETDTRRHG